MPKNQKKIEEEKKLRCPFGDLECSECRLYQVFHVGDEQVTICAFVWMSRRAL